MKSITTTTQRLPPVLKWLCIHKYTHFLGSIITSTGTDHTRTHCCPHCVLQCSFNSKELNRVKHSSPDMRKQWNHNSVATYTRSWSLLRYIYRRRRVAARCSFPVRIHQQRQMQLCSVLSTWSYLTITAKDEEERKTLPTGTEHFYLVKPYEVSFCTIESLYGYSYNSQA